MVTIQTTRFIIQEGTMDEQQLQQLVERLSLEHFQKPFVHRAYFNKRLRSTGGRYLLHSHHIELNEKSYITYGEAELVGIILHELCHYHLHLEGKGYMHKDREFKQLLKQVGAPRYCRAISVQQTTCATNYMYECIQCFIQYNRHRKINTTKYVGGKCKGQLKTIYR